MTLGKTAEFIAINIIAIKYKCSLSRLVIQQLKPIRKSGKCLPVRMLDLIINVVVFD